ncbi:helix-turn-helix domain-containing protein [Polluticoccus soli]|uniref:helix-turn-helix domain-containing protein n=1 Tax=Polluticoccus soli TaxID=3034150 RepID=UPI0023E1044A|nr:helix-turn-helix transcriptional regulator [Flavipsychrobacter sp. JY13-12]
MLKFGKRVREIREKKGISQQELAHLCQLEYSQINRIELGKINTSISHVFLLAENLEVSIQELLKFK